MLKRFALVIVLLVSALATATAGAAADPTLHQVYQAASSGHMNEAQQMMAQVLRDHPNSAKAHFVEAELLAKQGNLPSARSELATAQKLAPGLPFAKQQAVSALESRLAGGARAAGGYVQQRSHGLPWGTILIGVGILAAVVVAMRAVARRNQAFYPGGPAARYGNGGYGNAYPPGSYPSYPGGGMGAPMGGGMGSGIVGGLATGAAMGAGLVAGEALMHHFTDSNEPRLDTAAPADTSWNPVPDNMGGNDFGIADNGSWDDGGSSWDSGGDWDSGSDWNS